MTDTAAPTEKKKRFRSPAYPALDLAKAVERTASLLKVAQHHAVGVSVILPAWGMDSAAGPVWRYLAALIQYGLVTDSGGGKARKFQITDVARRIIQDGDQNSKRRKEALKIAALSPTIHKELWEKFGTAADLSESVLKVYLTLDRKEAGESPYSETAASEVIQAYKSTLGYAGILDSDSVATRDDDKGAIKVDAHSGDNPIKVSVGDYVQWVSNGVEQFTSPRRVIEILPDATHVQVFGSNTGIPMTELNVVDPPILPPMTPPPTVARTEAASAWAQSENDLNVLQKGNRLQITADVDLEGLDELKEILGHYEAILKRLGARKSK
jgi:hypothetical protein